MSSQKQSSQDNPTTASLMELVVPVPSIHPTQPPTHSPTQPHPSTHPSTQPFTHPVTPCIFITCLSLPPSRFSHQEDELFFSLPFSNLTVFPDPKKLTRGGAVSTELVVGRPWGPRATCSSRPPEVRHPGRDGGPRRSQEFLTAEVTTCPGSPTKQACPSSEP